MKYFLLFTLLVILSCKKEVVLSRPDFADDPIHLDYQKKIKQFESEHEKINSEVNMAKSRISDASFSPKVAEIIKSEIFVQEKYLRLIEQQISYFKMKDNERSHYYLENKEQLNEETVKKDHEDHLLKEKVNPQSYIWRKRPGLVLPPLENNKKEEPKKEDHGSGGH